MRTAVGAGGAAQFAGGERVERLAIDWSPVSGYFSAADLNASFEGIAVGDGRLYVANERMSPLIMVVDLAALKVVDQFQVFPSKPSLLGTHYAGLECFGGRLFVLLRQHRVVLEVDPRTHRIAAEYDYGALEGARGVRLSQGLPSGRDGGVGVGRGTHLVGGGQQRLGSGAGAGG